MFKALLKDTFIYGFGDFVFKFISFIVFPVYTSIFTVEEFGIMNLVLTFAGFFATFLGLGVSNSVNRYYWDSSVDIKIKPTMVSTGLIIIGVSSAIVTTLILFILYPLSTHIYNKYGVSFYIIFLALLGNIFTQILQYCLELLRLQFSPVKYLLASAIKNLSGIVLGLILIIVFKQKLLGYFNGILYATLIATPFAIYMGRKDINLKFDKEIAKMLIEYGYPFLFSSIAYWVFTSMDRLMLAELSNNLNVGLYSIAGKFATIIFFLNVAFGQAWSPFAIKLMSEDKNYKILFANVLTYLFFILSFIGMFVSLFSYELLRFMTPQEYWAAANCTALSVMGVAISGTTQITGIGITIEKKTKLFSTISWITALVNFVFNLILIPYFGAVGTAFSTFISYSVLTLSYLYWTQKLHTIPIEKTKLYYCCFIVVSSILATLFFNSIEWDITIIILKLIFCSIILVLSISLKIIDLSIINKYIKGKIN